MYYFKNYKTAGQKKQCLEDVKKKYVFLTYISYKAK
jgi:hypothetical protein